MLALVSAARERRQRHMSPGAAPTRAAGRARLSCVSVTVSAFGCNELNHKVEQNTEAPSTRLHEGFPPPVSSQQRLTGLLDGVPEVTCRLLQICGLLPSVSAAVLLVRPVTNTEGVWSVTVGNGIRGFVPVGGVNAAAPGCAVQWPASRGVRSEETRRCLRFDRAGGRHRIDPGRRPTGITHSDPWRLEATDHVGHQFGKGEDRVVLVGRSDHLGTHRQAGRRLAHRRRHRGQPGQGGV